MKKTVTFLSTIFFVLFACACSTEANIPDLDTKINSVLQEVKAQPTTKENMQKRFQVLVSLVHGVENQKSIELSVLLPQSEAPYPFP